MPRTKKDSLIETTLEYKNRMAQEKLRRITLQNDTAQFDLNKKNESICYRAVAMQEFENAISSVYNQIKNMSEQLTQLLQLNVQQADLLNQYSEALLTELSNIDVELSNTEAFDNENYYTKQARKARMSRDQ